MTTEQNQNQPRGNKGEWSEFYAFIKILTDGEIFAADADLEIIRDKFFTVLKIIRNERSGKKYYDISANDGSVSIVNDDGQLLDKVNLDRIKSGVLRVFSEMKNSTQTTFEITPASEMMNDLHCTQIKASNSRKEDLSIVIYDRISAVTPELGFSIKSMLGSPSTLLNASGATNFTYIIKDDDQLVNDTTVNGLGGSSKVMDRSKEIYNSGGDLEFYEMDNEKFKRNLKKIDSNFPEIMSEIIKLYYAGKGSKVTDLIDILSEDEAIKTKFDLSKEDFEFKMKNFLCAVALGMVPSKEWDGFAKAHGGYIIVKENGDVVCYHLYNRDEFMEYLYNNTKFDSPGTTRHGYGSIYEEDGQRKIKYNLQIRFIK